MQASPLVTPALYFRGVGERMRRFKSHFVQIFLLHTSHQTLGKLGMQEDVNVEPEVER